MGSGGMRGQTVVFLDDWMVLTLQKGSSTQQVCITKTTTVKNFFHLLILTKYTSIGSTIGSSIVRSTMSFT